MSTVEEMGLNSTKENLNNIYKITDYFSIKICTYILILVYKYDINN